jgi:MYXO-CTERM domain-containing protein
MKHPISSCCILCTLVAISLPAYAHDMNVNTSFDYVLEEKTFEHQDADPWKGYVNFTVTNNGSEPWTDFHFQIFSVVGDATSVEIVETSPYEPTATGINPFTYVVGDAGGFDKLDYYFASDPVAPTETVTFTFYTDNPQHVSYFGLMAYPTPEPGLMTMLGVGGLMLLRRRKTA